jgi:hypothetical protein
MGFGGGGGGALPAHVHNAIPLQGGPLDFANDTIASLNAGSTTFSSGVALQELLIGSLGSTLIVNPGATAPQWLALGNAGDSMVVNAGATAPEWAAATPAASNYSFIESFTATANPTLTCTFATPLDVDDFVSLVAIWRGKWNVAGTGALELQIATDLESPITSNLYYWQGTAAASLSSSHQSGFGIDNFTIGPSVSAAGSRGVIKIELALYPGAGGGLAPSDIMVNWWQKGTNVIQSWSSGYTYSNVGAITSIDGFHFTNSAGNNIEAGTTVDFFKVTQ